MKGLEALIGKKGKSLDENSAKAQMEVLKDLKARAMEAMGNKLDGAKKVEVSANSSEGLKSGLDKAKELLGQDLSPQDETDNHDEESEDESPEEESNESDEVESLEDIEAKIHELLAKKQSLIGKK